jgi:DNA invertase Pin-like site-specific DNA recombinase
LKSPYFMPISLMQMLYANKGQKMPVILGYARVSTFGQTLHDQVGALKAAGADKVYAEKESGARSDRPQLKKAIASLGPGDTLIITRLDRLARSTRDLLNVLHDVAERGAAFKSLADVWADTTTPHGRLMLTVLGGLAEFERSLIAARTASGRKRAMANGVKFGRKPKLNAYRRAEALKLLDKGDSQSSVARLLDVDQSTISRLRA